MPTYPDISGETFRHPLDRQAEQALRSLPGFDLVATQFIKFFYERPQMVYHMGNSIQVGARQYSSVYQIFRECVRDLDISPEPVLFVSQTPVVNAYALGHKLLLNTSYSSLVTVPCSLFPAPCSLIKISKIKDSEGKTSNPVVGEQTISN